MTKFSVCTLLAVVTLTGTTANAQTRYYRSSCPNGQCPAPTYYYPVQVQVAQPVPTVTQASYTAQAATATTGDPYGFGAWLNAYRASAGLPALAHDANLSGHAAASNQAVRAYGWGRHWYMGGTTYQNLGAGAGATVWSMWTRSSGHIRALLGNATHYGIAFDGWYWTYNAR